MGWRWSDENTLIQILIGVFILLLIVRYEYWYHTFMYSKSRKSGKWKDMNTINKVLLVLTCCLSAYFLYKYITKPDIEKNIVNEEDKNK